MCATSTNVESDCSIRFEARPEFLQRVDAWNYRRDGVIEVPGSEFLAMC